MRRLIWAGQDRRKTIDTDLSLSGCVKLCHQQLLDECHLRHLNCQKDVNKFRDAMASCFNYYSLLFKKIYNIIYIDG